MGHKGLNLKPDFHIIIWIVSGASIFYSGRCKPTYVNQPIYRAWLYPDELMPATSNKDCDGDGDGDGYENV